MTAIDWTGVLVLAYATVASVWTLCEARTTSQLRALALDRERPSSLPRRRW